MGLTLKLGTLGFKRKKVFGFVVRQFVVSSVFGPKQSNLSFCGQNKIAVD
jgi:hypothetical protein